MQISLQKFGSIKLMALTKPLVDEFGILVSSDLLNLLLGPKLGEGSFRKVYQLESDPGKVLKVEVPSQSFYNVMEWEIWQEAPAKWRKWLAPCFDISPSGCALIQAKVERVERRPRNIPSFLDDNKLSNWGKYNGRIVCCDYGHHRFFKDGFRKTKLRCGRDLWRTPLVDL